MKAHFLSSLIYVLLVMLIIPGMTPGMASAADETVGDIGSSDAGDSDQGDADQGDSDQGDSDSDTGDSDQGDTDQGDSDSGDTDQGDSDSGDSDQGDSDPGDSDQGDSDSDTGDSDQGDSDSDTGDSDSDTGDADPGDSDQGDSDSDTGDSDSDPGDSDQGDSDSDTGDSDSDTGDSDSGNSDSGDSDTGISEDGGSSGSSSNSNSGSKSSSSSSSNSSSSSSPNSNSNSSSSSSSNSSSGSGSSSGSSSIGSGVSTEPANNIEIKELATRNVISGYHIRYDFPENVTCITHIEYDSKRTFRKTTAIVEVLNNKSALVSKLPAGRIYKHVNIWVGENAAGLPTSLKNGLVGFRVEKKWIENNNVSESLVTLQWYNKGWKPLDTEKIGEDENYIYFKSKTPGYSFFAITEYSTEDKDKEETQLQKTLRSLSGQNGIDEKPMKAAKILIAFSLPLFALLVGYAVLKKKI